MEGPIRIDIPLFINKINNNELLHTDFNMTDLMTLDSAIDLVLFALSRKNGQIIIPETYATIKIK